MMKRTLIFAHRGANREAAENTRAAFDLSLADPIDGIETDVQLSRDAVPVLWHDRYLGKLGHPDKHIDDFELAELRRMDFAAHFPGALPEAVMTLQEFFDTYRSRCNLLVEIKNREWEPISRHEDKMRQALAMAGSAQGDSVMLSSFNLDSLVYAHRLDQGFPLVYNFEPEQTYADARRVMREHPFLRGFCLPIALLNEEMAGLLHEHRKKIAVYTCNSDEEIGQALRLGVDTLISDVPQKAIALRLQQTGET